MLIRSATYTSLIVYRPTTAVQSSSSPSPSIISAPSASSSAPLAMSFETPSDVLVPQASTTFSLDLPSASALGPAASTLPAAVAPGLTGNDTVLHLSAASNTSSSAGGRSLTMMLSDGCFERPVAVGIAVLAVWMGYGIENVL